MGLIACLAQLLTGAFVAILYLQLKGPFASFLFFLGQLTLKMHNDLMHNLSPCAILPK